MSLTTKQRQYLRGLGHALKPMLQIGKDGINDRQLASISKVLEDHELVKLNILENSDLDKNEVERLLCEPLKAELVQVLGKKMLLYRKSKENVKIKLP